MIRPHFYEFDQHPSHGSIIVNDLVCHRLFIAAHNLSEAIDFALELGVYFNGVRDRIDCTCCGDRWKKPWNPIDLEHLKEEGLSVSLYSFVENAEEVWNEKYRRFPIKEEPTWEQPFEGAQTSIYRGVIYFNDIEQYVQYLANETGLSHPDARIYYLDGSVTEIFSNKTQLKLNFQ